MINSEVIIFGNLGGGFTSYPSDSRVGMLQQFQNSANSSSKLTIHRNGKLMYYAFMSNLDAPERFIGLCVVVNSIMFTDIEKLFSILEENMKSIKSKVAGNMAEGAQLIDERIGIDKVADGLRSQLNSIELTTAPLPPESYASQQGSHKTFDLTSTNSNAIVEASHKYSFVHITKNSEVIIFGNLGGGFTSYPYDNRVGMLQQLQNSANSSAKLTIHRDGKLMYYAYMSNLDSPERFIGLCIVVNSIMFTDIEKLFSFFEENIKHVKSKVAGNKTEGVQLIDTKIGIDKVADDLCSRLNNIEVNTTPLPPESYASQQGSHKTFDLKPSKYSAIVEAGNKYSFVHIFKKEKNPKEIQTGPTPVNHIKPEVKKTNSFSPWIGFLIGLAIAATVFFYYYDKENNDRQHRHPIEETSHYPSTTPPSHTPSSDGPRAPSGKEPIESKPAPPVKKPKKPDPRTSETAYLISDMMLILGEQGLDDSSGVKTLMDENDEAIPDWNYISDYKVIYSEEETGDWTYTYSCCINNDGDVVITVKYDWPNEITVGEHETKRYIYDPATKQARRL